MKSLVEFHTVYSLADNIEVVVTALIPVRGVVSLREMERSLEVVEPVFTLYFHGFRCVFYLRYSQRVLFNYDSGFSRVNLCVVFLWRVREEIFIVRHKVRIR